MNILPTKNNILIEKLPIVDNSTIILKSSLEPNKASVLKIGPDTKEISINDVVIANWNSATHVMNDLYIIPESEIIMILE